MRIAKSNAFGYETSRLLTHIVERNLLYRNTLNDLSIDASITPSMCGILSAYFQTGRTNSFKVLEIGGGGGHLAASILKLFPNLGINWQIIETESLVFEARNNGLEMSNLRFLTASEYRKLPSQTYGILVANSVLQYVENPISYLASIIEKHSFDSFYIGKTPFVFNGAQVIGTQFSRLSSNGPRSQSLRTFANVQNKSNSDQSIIEYQVQSVNLAELQRLLVNSNLMFEFFDGYLEIHRACTFLNSFQNHKFCQKERLPTWSMLYCS